MQLVKQMNEIGKEAAVRTAPGGLAGWLLSSFARLRAGAWRGKANAHRRELHLVETLPLGGRRQLMLVRCAGEQFLIGAGPDSISSMIRVPADTRPETDATKRLAEPWT